MRTTRTSSPNQAPQLSTTCLDSTPSEIAVRQCATGVWFDRLRWFAASLPPPFQALSQAVTTVTGMWLLDSAPWLLRLIGAVLYVVALIAVLRVAWTFLRASLNSLIAPLGIELRSLSGLLSLID